MRPVLPLAFLFLSLFSCKSQEDKKENVLDETQPKVVEPIKEIDLEESYLQLFSSNPSFKAEGFDFPVGKPDAKGYYNAQKFTENNHLGDDWNGVGGGNTDMGDAIFTIGNGYVSFVENIGGGWGKVVRVIHMYKGKLYESLYAHCKDFNIKEGEFIKKGTKIATIGNADGAYYAHLHLEIRDQIAMEIGGGYSEDTTGYLDPSQFIKANRTDDL